MLVVLITIHIFQYFCNARSSDLAGGHKRKIIFRNRKKCRKVTEAGCVMFVM